MGKLVKLELEDRRCSVFTEVRIVDTRVPKNGGRKFDVANEMVETEG